MKVKRRAVFSLLLVTLGLEDRKRSNFRWVIKRILPRHCVIHVIQLSPSCNKSQKQIKWILNKEIVNQSIDIWRQKHNFFNLLNMLMEAILPLYLFAGRDAIQFFVLFYFFTLPKFTFCSLWVAWRQKLFVWSFNAKIVMWWRTI